MIADSQGATSSLVVQSAKLMRLVVNKGCGEKNPEEAASASSEVKLISRNQPLLAINHKSALPGNFFWRAG